jgi:hypothetical protein
MDGHFGALSLPILPLRRRAKGLFLMKKPMVCPVSGENRSGNAVLHSAVEIQWKSGGIKGISAQVGVLKGYRRVPFGCRAVNAAK